MAEPKSRRETVSRARPRPKLDVAGGRLPPGKGAEAAGEPQRPAAPPEGDRPGEAVATTDAAGAPPPPRFDDDYAGFDDEVNSRYEEIKRGSTHISELQQM